MGFSQEAGYTPQSIEAIMTALMDEINTQFGTTYTYETFIGTNFYKYFYAAAQRIQENEVKASEVFTKLQQYFDITNERIQRPVATSSGVIEALETAGYVASVKPIIEADAGKCNICVDVDETADDYADMKAEICEIIKDSVAAGVVTLGAESETIVLSNGQPFDFKYHLPDRVEPDLKLTITLSDNNQVVIDSPETIKQRLIDNIAAKYRLGRDFEPQRYFTTADAPWASSVLLEYDIGSGFVDDIFEADFDDLFVINLENITLVEV